MPVLLRRTTYSQTDSGLKIVLLEGTLADYRARTMRSVPVVPAPRKAIPQAPIYVAVTNGTLPNLHLPAPVREFEAPSASRLPVGREAVPLSEASAPSRLSDIIEQIRNDEDLAPSARRDQISAIERLCRLSNTAPSAVPASVPYIKELLAPLNPAYCDISPRTYQNFVSLIRKVMKREASIEPTAERTEPGVRKLWDDLFKAAEDSRRLMVLRRLKAYCISNGWTPDEVTQDTLSLFGNTLEQNEIMDHALHIRHVTTAWNFAAKTVPGWPSQRLNFAKSDRRFTRDWNTFPLSLQKDVDAYILSRTNPKLTVKKLGGKRAARPLKQSSAGAIRYSFRALASALVESETLAITEIHDLSVLIEPDNAEASLGFFVKRHGDQVESAQTHQLAYTLLTTAKLWGKLDPETRERVSDPATIEALGHLRDQCSKVQTSMTQKNSERLSALTEPKILSRLFGLSAKLEQSAAATSSPKLGASRMQVAVAIELLLQCPIRIGNVAALDLSKHFIKGTAGPKGKTHLAIPKAEVKNEVNLDFEVPPELARLIETYVKKYRPALTGPSPTNFLFPRPNGKHIASNTLSAAIVRETTKHLGVKMNPHLFRHFAATLHLEANPGQYESVRRLLGQKNIRTTTTYYCGQETVATSKHYQQVLLERRSRGNQV